MFSLYKKRSVGESMTDAFRFYKDNFKKIVIILSILTLPLGIIYVISSDNDPLEFSFPLFALSMLIIFLLSVVQNFISPYIIRSYMDHNNSIEIAAVIRGFMRRYFSFLGLNLAYMGLLFAVYLGAVFVIVILSFSPPLAIVGAFGVFTLVVYMVIKFVYVYHIYAIENLDIGRAFSKASQIIKGYWWETFGLAVIIFMLYFTATAVSIGILSIFVNFENILDLNAATPVFSVWYSVITVFLSIIFLPFAHMSFTMHYLNLIERTESKSVLNMVDDFGKDE